MDFLLQLQALIANLSALQTTVTELQTKLTDTEAALAETKKASYDEGFAAGVLSVGNGDKVYTQAEAEALVAAAVAPLNEQVAVLAAKVAELEAKIVDVEAVKAEAVAAFKVELKSKYEEQQVAETAGETGFATLLN